MRKTIIAYILTCIEEIPNDFELGAEVRLLQDKIFEVIEKKPDDLMNILFIYTQIFPNDQQLGLEVRNLYNEIKYFFNEYTPST
jgi:hypothetical protein